MGLNFENYTEVILLDTLVPGISMIPSNKQQMSNGSSHRFKLGCKLYARFPTRCRGLRPTGYYSLLATKSYYFFSATEKHFDKSCSKTKGAAFNHQKTQSSVRTGNNCTKVAILDPPQCAILADFCRLSPCHDPKLPLRGAMLPQSDENRHPIFLSTVSSDQREID